MRSCSSCVAHRRRRGCLCWSWKRWWWFLQNRYQSTSLQACRCGTPYTVFAHVYIMCDAVYTNGILFWDAVHVAPLFWRFWNCADSCLSTAGCHLGWALHPWYACVGHIQRRSVRYHRYFVSHRARQLSADVFTPNLYQKKMEEAIHLLKVNSGGWGWRLWYTYTWSLQSRHLIKSNRHPNPEAVINVVLLYGMHCVSVFIYHCFLGGWSFSEAILCRTSNRGVVWCQLGDRLSKWDLVQWESNATFPFICVTHLYVCAIEPNFNRFYCQPSGWRVEDHVGCGQGASGQKAMLSFISGWLV